MRSGNAASDAQLVGLLEDVGAYIDDPATPYLAARVRAEVSVAAAPGHARLRRWRFALAGVAVAAALSTVLAFSPATRRAVAGWLGLEGVEIERGDVPPATALAGELDLGEPVTLAEASRRAGFDLVLLPEREFGPPDELYFVDAPGGGRVDAIYATEHGLPTLLTQFRGDTAEGPLITKNVGDDVVVEPVTVDGRDGVWLEGGPHTVTYVDANGEPRVDHTRLAGNTLIWERDGLTLRLESDFSREEAIALAEDVVVTPRR